MVYIANSPLISQILFTNSGVTRMTTMKQYDYLNRLTQISSVPSAASPLSFNYTYDSADQRVLSRLADGGYWRYQYDALGQVAGGHKFFSDQTPVAGEQFDYAFDTIGNRTRTKAGGDQNGSKQQIANYSANNLNQYTSRDFPGYLDILGLGLATNTIIVNGITADRKGEFFHQQLQIGNGSNPQWASITVAEAGQATVSGNRFLC